MENMENIWRIYGEYMTDIIINDDNGSLFLIYPWKFDDNDGKNMKCIWK